MKVNTVLKIGSMAFNIAQDEKVRELANMIHKGAKRRGLLSPPPDPRQQYQNRPASSPLPWWMR